MVLVVWFDIGNEQEERIILMIIDILKCGTLLFFNCFNTIVFIGVMFEILSIKER